MPQPPVIWGGGGIVTGHNVTIDVAENPVESALPHAAAFAQFS